MLEKINSPEDIKGMDLDSLNCLCGELRTKILDTVSKNGGHLASNLGMVEATVAIHTLFDSPRDSIVFDVGHQSYAHKLLTGRYSSFDTLRQLGGITGFTNPKESDHDVFYEGHSGTSIASAVGIAAANKLLGSDAYTVAVVGDGASTNGMVFEALNNLTDKELRLIIILNDNEMSISHNVGNFNESLREFRTSKSYFSFKSRLKRRLRHIPGIGDALNNFAVRLRDLVRRMLVKDNLYEILGIDYLGPVDGNDLEKLMIVLNEAKSKNSISVVHMVTKKGLGYKFSETMPEYYHSTGPFDLKKGVDISPKDCFSTRFGHYLSELGYDDDRIVAITAAMKDGTGLDAFSKAHPDRFFDVGIAEEYACTFSLGLAKKGIVPVCAIYSTFIQRCFDQVFHDGAIQDAHIIYALDRAGFVEGDGITHQGVYDISLFSMLPNTTIYSPETYEELNRSLKESVNASGLCFVRYPKGKELDYDRSGFTDKGSYSVFEKQCDKPGLKKVCFITYSRVTKNVFEAANRLSEERDVKIIKLVKIHPLDMDVIREETKDYDIVCFVEETSKSGSIGEKAISSGVFDDKEHLIFAIGDRFVPSAKVDELYKIFELDNASIVRKINELN